MTTFTEHNPLQSTDFAIKNFNQSSVPKQKPSLSNTSSIKSIQKICRQNNIKCDEDRSSETSLDKFKPSKPLISILSYKKSSNTNIFTVTSPNNDSTNKKPYSSSTLPLSKLRQNSNDKPSLKRINSQTSLKSTTEQLQNKQEPVFLSNYSDYTKNLNENHPNSLSVMNNSNCLMVDDALSRKSSFNSVR